jgi:sensor histidine kinase YesM
MRRHLSLFLTGLVLGILVFGFINFEQTKHIDQLLLSGLLGVAVAYIVDYSNPILNGFLSWKRYTGIRLLLGILWNTLCSFVLIWLSIWAYRFSNNGTSFWNAMDMETGLKLGILLFCAAVIYNIAYFAFYSYNQYTTAQLQELKTERKQAELQLATLRSQLSPHFLFNCINSLSVLFHDNTEKAERFIRAMAKSYQYTLEHCRTSLISVKEELEFVESYAFLLGTRFGDAFGLKINLQEHHLLSKIPPLTLQLLIENAVKHNAISALHPMELTITGTNTSLRITNNKALKKQVLPSTGIGLKNITQRYKILSKAKIKIEDTECFTVTLPLLKDE